MKMLINSLENPIVTSLMVKDKINWMEDGRERERDWLRERGKIFQDLVLIQVPTPNALTGSEKPFRQCSFPVPSYISPFRPYFFFPRLFQPLSSPLSPSLSLDEQPPPGAFMYEVQRVPSIHGKRKTSAHCFYFKIYILPSNISQSINPAKYKSKLIFIIICGQICLLLEILSWKSILKE